MHQPKVGQAMHTRHDAYNSPRLPPCQPVTVKVSILDPFRVIWGAAVLNAIHPACSLQSEDQTCLTLPPPGAPDSSRAWQSMALHNKAGIVHSRENCIMAPTVAATVGCQPASGRNLAPLTQQLSTAGYKSKKTALQHFFCRRKKHSGTSLLCHS